MIASLALFDQCDRTNSTYKGRTEQDFEFLNRSADPKDQAIRNVVESWFARFPQEKKADVRARFREDNGPHSGVLLELVTHEFLNAIGTDVQVEPDLQGLTPDFEATSNSVRILVECTVVQPSSARMGADKREAVFKKALDTIDTGRFRLWVEVSKHGPKPPSTRKLKRKIRDWLIPFDPDKEILRIKHGGELSQYVWTWEGWEVYIKVLPLNPGGDKEKEERAIGAELVAEFVTADHQIQRALEKKSEKYKASQLPYVIVVSHSLGLINVELHDILKNSLVDALFGSIKWRVPTDLDLSITPIQAHRSFDGLFGSPSKPENRGVSAVLLKRQLTVTNPSIPGYSPDQLPPWTLYHHPEAERPLPRGLFPFAADVDITKTPQIAPATRTLSELLNLPVIAKEKYSLEGGLWEAILG